MTMSEVMTGASLDEWMMEPDCPQCGSEDVVLKQTTTDGLGRTIKVWYCNKCGHTWTEVVA